jgi:hypothetical protein
MLRRRDNNLFLRRIAGFENLPFAISELKNRKTSIWGMLIWLWMILSPVFFSACGGENQEFGSENQIIKLIGPVAYKGIDDKMVVEGMVQNTGEQSLENIMIVVSWFDHEKDLLSVVENKIDRDILPAQGTSNYRLEKEFDLRMDNYSLMFYNKKKELLSIYHLNYSGP